MSTVRHLFSKIEGKMDEQIKELIHTNAIYTVTNSSGILEYANGNYCKTVGYDLIDLLGEPNELLRFEEEGSLNRLKLWQIIKTGNSWSGILKCKSKNGKMVWLKSKIIPLRSDSVESKKFLTLHENITFLKSRSELIKNDTAMYRHIYDSVKIGIVVVLDAQGNIIKWNKGAERSFGYTHFEILGKPFSGLVSKKYKKANFKEFLRLIERYKRTHNQEVLELNCLDSSGQEFPVEFVLSKWSIKGVQFFGVKMLDITKRHAFENRLKQKTKELELFLYRSAHDLNTPFASAQGLINLMKGETGNEKMAELIAMLEKTIDHAKVLSNGLAKASLVSTLKTERKEIDFTRILNNVMNSLKGQGNLEHVKFNIDIQETEGFTSNPSLMFTIFQNLLQNAIKYTGPISSKRMPCVDILVAPSSHEVVLQVCDNGIGIEAKNLDKIFELYYRAKAEQEPGSNGLGLYIVKKIVDSLNGWIEVDSQVDQRTCFTIGLPIPYNEK